jgi:hypothetical protein
MANEAKREIANAPKNSNRAAYNQGVVDTCASITAAVVDGLIELRETKRG